LEKKLQEKGEKKNEARGKKKDKPEKKSVPVEAYEELSNRYEELAESYDSLASELEMAQKELAAVEAIRKGEHMPMIMTLHQQIRSMTEARNQWQNTCNELTQQLKHVTKKK